MPKAALSIFLDQLQLAHIGLQHIGNRDRSVLLLIGFNSGGTFWCNCNSIYQINSTIQTNVMAGWDGMPGPNAGVIVFGITADNNSAVANNRSSNLMMMGV